MKIACIDKSKLTALSNWSQIFSQGETAYVLTDDPSVLAAASYVLPHPARSASTLPTAFTNQFATALAPPVGDVQPLGITSTGPLTVADAIVQVFGLDVLDRVA